MNRPPEHWIETLRNFALELGFDTFVFWPEEEPLVQIQRLSPESMCEEATNATVYTVTGMSKAAMKTATGVLP